MAAELPQHMSSAKPLKILELEDKSSEVTIMRDNLEIVGRNLQESGASHVSIVTVMGAYRTGKSFLLTLLSRFLKAKMDEMEKDRQRQEELRRYGNSHANGDSSRVDSNRVNVADEAEGQVGPTFIGKTSSEAAGQTQAQAPEPEIWKYGENDNNADFKIADWIQSVDATRLSEGTDGDASGCGFEWKPGKDKCTRGIWMWDRPLVFANKEGKKVAVLLMDTQGAWDGTMTKAQSATIFGLTALLSSKLILNIQNRIDECSLDHLDYIITFAQTICNELPGTDSPYGHLSILVRDWANYEDGATREQCHAVMKQHLDHHLSLDGVKEESVGRVERLKSTFRSIQAFGLPHPGKEVTKLQYKGELGPIDNDFMFLLDDFVRGLFDENFPEPSAPLGTKIACSHFVQVVMNFAEAFHDNAEARAIDMRKAFVTVEMMSAKEQLLKEFKEGLEKAAPNFYVLDPDALRTKVEELCQRMKGDYAAKLRPWKLKHSEELAATKEYNALLDDIAQARLSLNETAVNGAAVKLVASPVVGCGGYFLLGHPLLAAAAVVGGIYVEVKKWTTRLPGADVCDSRVTAGIQEDVQNWCIQRWLDMQAIYITLKRLTPQKAQEHFQAARQQATAYAASAAVQASAGSGAPASSSSQ